MGTSEPSSAEDRYEQEKRDKAQRKAKEMRDKRRAEVAPWITKGMWDSIDKLSKIPPFNQPNRKNMEPNLAAHIEKYPHIWYSYINKEQAQALAKTDAAKLLAEELKQEKEDMKIARQRAGPVSNTTPES